MNEYFAIDLIIPNQIGRHNINTQRNIFNTKLKYNVHSSDTLSQASTKLFIHGNNSKYTEQVDPFWYIASMKIPKCVKLL